VNLQIVSLEMGYGHLRAAYPIADALSCPLFLADEPPLAGEKDARLWQLIRKGHTLLSRPGGSDWLVRQANALMDLVTIIPPMHERTDQSRPDFATKFMNQLVKRGLGSGLVEYLRERRSALLTTIYAPALVANAAGIERIYCVVTDADVQRVWVPYNARESRIHYFAPSTRVARRLQAYGVRESQITLTGFPLPYELTNETALESLRGHVARRIARLDPEGSFRRLHAPVLSRILGDLPETADGPLVLTIAIGGAGAQADLAEAVLPRLKDRLRDDRMHLNLVAGTRSEVAERFAHAVESARLTSRLGKSINIIYEPSFREYYRRFNALLSETDVLWTKPSELSFYAGLGIPLVVSQPVGTHERYNRRWLRERGAALKQRRVEHFPGWFDEWLADGTLAACAWSAFTRIPSDGTLNIVRALRQKEEPTPASAEPGERGLE
jgi:hypothetical protein